MVMLVKSEPSHRAVPERRAELGGREAGESSSKPGDKGVTERRVIRSRYLAVKNLISDEREDIGSVGSDRFRSIITEVESLHELVQKPREQVADAEALLDIANSLVTAVKSQSNEGVTLSDFVTALLRNFGQDGSGNADNARNISWSEIGLAVSHVLRKVPGCQTMIGPMSAEMKQRKVTVHRKRTLPTERTCPEELDVSESGVKTGTDKNMSTMFDVLRKKSPARLENLVLNRMSFAQTVENIFALSFLVKDGRAQITVDDSGSHLVSPRNAPTATSVASGSVSYHHFIFRFDFQDWKKSWFTSLVSSKGGWEIPFEHRSGHNGDIGAATSARFDDARCSPHQHCLMVGTVNPGEELMPHRSGPSTSGTSQAEPMHDGGSESVAPTTPIRKLTRNRGLVTQEQSVVDDTHERKPSDRESSLRPKVKRRRNSP